MDLKEIKVVTGENLHDLSMRKPIMLVFLRHFGCVFCREAIYDLSKKKEDLESRNIEIIFVHMTTPEIAEKYFSDFNLNSFKHISDESCELYAQFGLVKGNFSQLFGFNNWVRGFEAREKGINWTMERIGDSLQMPGIFLIINGQLRNSYIHKSVSDKPDYDYLINCCVD